MAGHYDEEGNWVEEDAPADEAPPPDTFDSGGAPPPSDLGASLNQTGESLPSPSIGADGMVSWPGETQDAGAPPPVPVPSGPSGSGGGPAPSGPSAGAPPPAQAPAPGPDNSWRDRFNQMQGQWQKDWLAWQQQYANDQKALADREFGFKQTQANMQNQIEQGKLDLARTIEQGNRAYQAALLDSRNHELATQAAGQAMTRDLQTQEVQLRREQNANQLTTERERADLQRRLLPASRTARRAATVQIT